MGASAERERQDKTEREREREGGRVIDNCNKTNASGARGRGVGLELVNVIFQTRPSLSHLSNWHLFCCLFGTCMYVNCARCVR